MATETQCKLALDLHGDALSGLTNVTGLGIVPISDDEEGADAEMAVAVYVSRKLPRGELKEEQVVPQLVRVVHEGRVVDVPTRVVEAGVISFGPPSLA